MKNDQDMITPVHILKRMSYKILRPILYLSRVQALKRGFKVTERQILVESHTHTYNPTNPTHIPILKRKSLLTVEEITFTGIRQLKQVWIKGPKCYLSSYGSIVLC